MRRTQLNLVHMGGGKRSERGKRILGRIRLPLRANYLPNRPHYIESSLNTEYLFSYVLIPHTFEVPVLWHRQNLNFTLLTKKFHTFTEIQQLVQKLLKGGGNPHNDTKNLTP